MKLTVLPACLFMLAFELPASAANPSCDIRFLVTRGPYPASYGLGLFRGDSRLEFEQGKIKSTGDREELEKSEEKICAAATTNMLKGICSGGEVANFDRHCKKSK